MTVWVKWLKLGSAPSRRSVGTPHGHVTTEGRQSLPSALFGFPQASPWEGSHLALFYHNSRLPALSPGRPGVFPSNNSLYCTEFL